MTTGRFWRRGAWCWVYGLALALPLVGARAGIAAETEERLELEKTVVVEENAHEWNNGSFDHQKIITFGDYQYTTYWDGEGYLKLARRNLRTNKVDVLGFPDKIRSPRDPHFTTVVGISPQDGRLHLSYGHHITPLNYRHSRAGFLTEPPQEMTLADFSERRWLVPDDKGPEGQVTYPMFFNGPEDVLHLVHRTGRTGSANTYLYRYDAAGNSWTRLGMLFTGMWEGKQTSSAYAQVPTIDKRGRLHMTWTWTLPVIHYAWSDDSGVTWKNNAGKQVADLAGGDPIGREDYTTVLESPGWVLWQGNLALDPGGQPHLFTLGTLPDAKGAHYRHYWRTADGGWHEQVIDDPAVFLKRGLLARGDLFFDDAGDLHVYFPFGGSLYTASASRGSGWSDWRIYRIAEGVAQGSIGMHTEDAGNHDRVRWARDRVLSVAYTQQAGNDYRFVIEDHRLKASPAPTALEITVRPMFLLPPAPVGKEAIRVRWESGGLGAESYDLWRREEGQTEFKPLAENFSQRSMRRDYVDENVQPGKAYTYRVVARNAFGQSPPVEAEGRIKTWPEGIATGASVTASSSGEKFPPDQSVDGRINTFWLSSAPATRDKPQWLEVDLGEPRTVSCLAMVPRLGQAFYGYLGPKEITWQVGDGDGEWRDIATIPAAPDERTVVRFDPITTRRIRLVISSSYEPRNVGVAEIGVFGDGEQDAGTR